jgi:hypothetical protein
MKTIAALLLFLAGAAQAAPIPAEIRAEYEVTSAGIRIGRVIDTYVRKGDTYSIQSITRSEGPLKLFLDDQVTLESSGRIVGGNLQPAQFGQRRAKDPSRDVSATFDWERGVIHSTYKGERKQIPLPRATQDRISLLYQLMNVTPGNGNMTIPMSNGRRVEVYTYRVVDDVRISTPAGEFDTLHLERVNSSPKENRAEVWLAKERFNFPVRVVFDDPKGLRVEQNLVALQAR